MRKIWRGKEACKTDMYTVKIDSIIVLAAKVIGASVY